MLLLWAIRSRSDLSARHRAWFTRLCKDLCVGGGMVYEIEFVHVNSTSTSATTGKIGMVMDSSRCITRMSWFHRTSTNSSSSLIKLRTFDDKNSSQTVLIDADGVEEVIGIGIVFTQSFCRVMTLDAILNGYHWYLLLPSAERRRKTASCSDGSQLNVQPRPPMTFECLVPVNDLLTQI